MDRRTEAQGCAGHMKTALLVLALTCRRTASLSSEAALGSPNLDQATQRVSQLRPFPGLYLVILLVPTKPERERLAAVQGQSMSAQWSR